MRVVTLSIVASMAATASLAGGYVAPVEEPAPIIAPVSPVTVGVDWTGFYAGLQYGQGSVKGDLLDGDDDDFEEDFDENFDLPEDWGNDWDYDIPENHQ